MEGRRVEGVLLDTAVLRNKAYEAYETAKAYEIRILSRVPEALLASMGDIGSRLRAKVVATGGGKVILALENGFEVEAQNRLSIPVKSGDELSLLLESKNPVTLRVEVGFSGLRGIRDMLRSALSVSKPILLTDNVRESIESSGVIYEKRVWDFLRGDLKIEALSKDVKFKLLKRLEEADLQPVQRFLRELNLKAELGAKRDSLLELLQTGKKLEFIRNLREFIRELSGEEKATELKLESIRTSVREIVKGMLGNFVRSAESFGILIRIDERTFSGLEGNPHSLNLFKEAIKSLELGKFEEFGQKLSLLGIKIENPEKLHEVKEKLLSLMRELVRGAEVSVSSGLGVKDTLELVKKFKELKEELEILRSTKNSLEESMSGFEREVKDLEAVEILQQYLLANEGRKLLIPFKVGDGRGALGLSIRDLYRVFIKLDFEEGFLGIVMEAPRKEKPDFINVIFKTDAEALETRIRENLDSLRKELSSLGLEVKNMEVIRESREEFDVEMSEELGGEGLFNLRV